MTTALTLAAPVVAPARPLAQRRRRIRFALALRVRLAFGAIASLLAALTAAIAPRLPAAEAAFAVAIGVAGIAATLATARWLLRAVVRPLQPATDAVARLSAGDLASPIDLHGAGDLQALMHSLNEVRERLFGVVNTVRTGTGNVALNAAQITRDNEALAARTTTQAASLQNTAASMEELTAAVQQNAHTTEQAHALVRTASERAAHGGTVMRDVVHTMQAIRASSGSIREIIGVIDGIAFQTNILALNAAVEAARAGDQGRGFAVVAAEVRTLARRCAEAAGEVKALIVASVEQVDAGGVRVDEAGQAMEAIVAAVQKLAGLIGAIDGASREQSTGVGTIGQAVAHLDAITQANAALVQNAAETAAALHARAQNVHGAVARFRLGEREHGSAADAIALVNAGCELVRTAGPQALLDEVNRLDHGRFIHRDLYLMVQDVGSAVFLAHGNNPGRLGSGPEVQDADGKHFAREFARVARESGEGWVDYKWVHPVTHEVYVKDGYVKREGDLVFSCAVYR